MKELFDKIVRECITRKNWTQRKAERVAHLVMKSIASNEARRRTARDGGSEPSSADVAIAGFDAPPSTHKVVAHLVPPGSLASGAKPKDARLPPSKKVKLKKNMKKAKVRQPDRPLTRAEISSLPPLVPPRPPPRNAKERMERALGPDEGHRRRGGSPTVQGGSPGLGRKR